VSVREKLTRLYEGSADPWTFETSWYEQRKYALTLASLPRERYCAGYEPGCSIGVLTELLAQRCDSLLASDFIPRAVDIARRRVQRYAHVRVEQLEAPAEWPEGPFDLIVLSELAYFLMPSDVVELGRRIAESTTDGATIVAVHWRGPIDEGALPAEAAHAVIQQAAELRRLSRYVEEAFLLELFER
jgi:hypothetical protein